MRQDSSTIPVAYRYRLTRLGVHFVFVAVFTMIGGSLRGFNLLLVLAGLLVGALLVQWRWSRWVIESSSATRFLPSEAFANVPFRVRYHVTNHSGFLPIWMIRIDDQIESSTSGAVSTAGCGVGVVGPDQVAIAFYDCVIASRGRYQLASMSISTLFPLSLLHASKIISKQSTLYVLPPLLKLRKGWQQTLVTRQGSNAATARRSGPNEGEFFGLREWQTGDSRRWIHHRTTARVGEPIVRQFEQQRQFDACLLIDCFDSRSQFDGETNDAETAISFAATIVASIDRSPANRIVLAVADSKSSAVAGGRGHGGKLPMLERLAEARISSSPNIVLALDQAAGIAGYAKDLVVISTRDLNDALKEDSADKRLASTLQAWQGRSGVRWINVRSTEFQNWVVRESVNSRAWSAPEHRNRLITAAQETANAQVSG